MPGSERTSVNFVTGDQVLHDEHGRGEVAWVYRFGLRVEFAGEEVPRHVMEWELTSAPEGDAHDPQ